MAVDMFLKLDGIAGESADDKHKGEIEINSFSWGATNTPASRGAGGGGAGKVSVQDFHFVSSVGIQSPPLLVATATGEHFKKAVLTIRKGGERPLDYLKITLEEVLVSSYQTGGSEGADAATDQFSLNFTKILMDVAVQSPDGTPRANVRAGYDVGKNVRI